MSLQEITGMEGEMITLQEIFTFEQTGLAEDRRVKGKFTATGIRPKFTEKFKALGIELSPEVFDPLKVYEV